MPGGHSELDILAWLPCHQEHSVGHPGNVVCHAVHYPHDAVHLIQILVSDKHDGAFVGISADKAGDSEEVSIRGQRHLGKWHVIFVAKVQNEASFFTQHIRTCLPSQKILYRNELPFTIQSKAKVDINKCVFLQ